MSENKRDVSFYSDENQTRDVVLGFIHDKDDKRVGLLFWNRETNTVHKYRLPKIDWQAWNLNINGGRLDPKCCNLSDFPILYAKGDVNPLAVGVKLYSKNSGAWVLGEYPDGRLRLISVAGQVKDVTKETALGFAKQYKIANADITEAGLVAKDGGRFVQLKPERTVQSEDLFYVDDAQGVICWKNAKGEKNYYLRDILEVVGITESLEPREFFKCLATDFTADAPKIACDKVLAVGLTQETVEKLYGYVSKKFPALARLTDNVLAAKSKKR